MAEFMRDLYRMPDKVEAVLDVIQPNAKLENIKAMLAAATGK